MGGWLRMVDTTETRTPWRCKLSINGRKSPSPCRIHCHMTMTDDNKAFGGHLEPGTDVFTFAILTLGVLDDSASLTGVDDKTIR